MIREPVISSNLSAVGYDIDKRTLEVEFKGGSVYQYYGVPESVYLGLISASSVGSYLNMCVKNIYQYRQVK